MRVTDHFSEPGRGQMSSFPHTTELSSCSIIRGYKLELERHCNLMFLRAKTSLSQDCVIS